MSLPNTTIVPNTTNTMFDDAKYSQDIVANHGETSYMQLMFNKLDIWAHMLKTYNSPFLLWIDGDVVFLKDPNPYYMECIQHMNANNLDFMFQCNNTEENKMGMHCDEHKINAGVVLMRNSQHVLNIINYDEIRHLDPESIKKTYPFDDESFLISRRHMFRFELFHPDTIRNGAYAIFRIPQDENTVLIHYSCSPGGALKLEHMKRDMLWFV